MFERFSDRARRALVLAQEEARLLDHGFIGTEHLLLGLMHEQDGVAAQALSQFDLSLETVRLKVQESVVNAFICEHCIREWSARLGRAKSTLATSWVSQRHDVVGGGPPPENAEAAAADIRAAFVGSGTESEDGVAVHTVEGGKTLGPVLVAAKEQHRGIASQDATVVTSVDEIVFTDPGHAAVWLSIAVDGTTMLSRRRGDAVVVDGVWKVTRSTFCELMALAAVQCPPGDRIDGPDVGPNDSEQPSRRGASSTAIPSVRRFLGNQLHQGSCRVRETWLGALNPQARAPHGGFCSVSLEQVSRDRRNRQGCSR